MKDMNRNVKNVAKNISASVLANGINMAFSVLLVLIVPKALGVKEYSYWQLYTFYASYVGFFHFGWADGIYLRFGGKRYEDLKPRYFNTQFWLLVLFEIAIAIIIAVLSAVFVPDVNKKFILSMVGVCCILQLPRTMLQYLMQITNRITEYARNQILEKVIYAAIVIGLLIIGIRKYEVLLLADLVSKLITLIGLMILCKNIVFVKVSGITEGIQEAYANISIGIKLLFSNIASMLITGIIRFGVEDCWSVETFGRVSLTMTVSNLLMIFIAAVSVVMYPMLKNVSEEKLSTVYSTVRNLLMIIVLGMLIVYYPAKSILSMWLPQYAESLKYMALLFPICVFESKMSMLISTYLKALRKEKDILKVNLISMCTTFILTGLAAYVMHNLTLTILLLTILLALRSILGEITLAKTLEIKVYKDIFLEVGLSAIFIFTSWTIDSWLCTMTYALGYIVYLFCKRKEIKEMIFQIKLYVKGV